MSKYLLNKFLYTVDRDPDLVERYREDPAGTAHHSARLPSPGAIPALVANQTLVPGGWSVDSATTPAPCTPGTYGKTGAPK